MSEVLENAKNYRKRLLREIARLDEFLRVADELSAGGQAESGKAKPVDKPVVPVIAQPRIEQPPIDRMPESRPEPTRTPEPEKKQTNGHMRGLVFRNALGPAELDRRALLA